MNVRYQIFEYLAQPVKYFFVVELAPWGLNRHRIATEYISAYQGYVDVSRPEQDFEGRLRLYML